MYKRVLETIHTHNLLPHKAGIVVGVSGGPDSMTLLDILYRLCKKRHYTLTIAHVHYGIRGSDAQRDRTIVENAAHTYGIPVIIKDFSHTRHPTNEAWMRNVRYAFFEDVRVTQKADFIVVGHTLNDLVETLLIRLIRGSGLVGLSALSYKRDTIVRPLLDCTRADIECYCTQHNITYGTDTTNTDIRYLRNRIRHDLLPHLQKRYNPNILTTLARTARHISDDYAELLRHTQKNIIQYTRNKNTITFDSTSFSAQTTSLQRMTLRYFAHMLTHTYPSSEIIEQWRTLIMSTKNKTQKMRTHTLILTKNGGTVSMRAHT